MVNLIKQVIKIVMYTLKFLDKGKQLEPGRIDGNICDGCFLEVGF
jgi:hypothetical protein